MHDTVLSYPYGVVKNCPVKLSLRHFFKVTFSYFEDFLDCNFPPFYCFPRSRTRSRAAWKLSSYKLCVQVVCTSCVVIKKCFSSFTRSIRGDSKAAFVSAPPGKLRGTTGATVDALLLVTKWARQ